MRHNGNAIAWSNRLESIKCDYENLCKVEATFWRENERKRSDLSIKNHQNINLIFECI
jgi:hypothetical protein